jgi:hypothetical protein
MRLLCAHNKHHDLGHYVTARIPVKLHIPIPSRALTFDFMAGQTRWQTAIRKANGRISKR